MKRAGPFFSYYGSKWNVSLQYPQPQYPMIIEPFAGSACYSLRHFTRDVLLVDAYQAIVDVWRYLIQATAEEILDLPILEPGENIHDCGLEPGPRDLIGYNLNQSQGYPARQLSKWARENHVYWKRRAKFWGPPLRNRIATQLWAIKHWQVIHGDYREAPDVEATWFIDPPYRGPGKHYKHSAIDYEELADWCRTRRGQVIVCEQKGADWLPFRHLCHARTLSSKKISAEVMWYSGEPQVTQGFLGV